MIINSENNSVAISSEELALIGKFARKELTQDEIYTFSIILCDNEIDRDNEKFTIPALKTLADLFVGKTGIFDHNMSSKDQTARIYATEFVTDETVKTSDGEPYSCVKARAYMVRTEKNKDLITEIEAGIKKETSVGCSVKKISCSICGKNIREDGCSHKKGKIYGGKLCCYLLEDPADAYEWSFVAVPAQKNAGVTKAFVPESSDEKVAAWAQEYRDELKAALIRDAASVIPEMKSAVLEEICNGMSIGMLKEMRDAFRCSTAKKMPFVRQLESEAENNSESNSEYKI
ncbi:MAG: hypothetical protein J6R20_09460 [Clostridia bacterium]|nr:hypothetical protein [Clostridia bacterium]